jgi:hypothetical protein
LRYTESNDDVREQGAEEIREEVAGGWRTLHNEELHNLYDSPYIIWVIKLRMMRWTEHEVRMD